MVQRSIGASPASRKMGNAVASIAVPWKWDILHRWKYGGRLKTKRHTAASAPLDKTANDDDNLSFSDRVLIVYDRNLCTTEEDDPSDAIIYFHPAEMMPDERCDLCCQLVGVVHFFNSCFDTPEALEMRSTRFAVRILGSHIVVLGATKSLSSYVLQQQVDMLTRLVRFYHGSLQDLEQMCSSKDVFNERVREFFNSCMPVCCGPKDQLSNLFRAVPTLQLPEAASNLYTKGYSFLEELQKMPGVLAGCIVFDEKVLASQFTPEITQLLLLAATSEERLAMQDVPVSYSVPPAVRLVNVYLEAAWLKDVAAINKQSNENPKELDKYAEEAADDPETLPGSTHSLREGAISRQTEKLLPPADDKEPELADSLSDVDSTRSSQATNQSSIGAPPTSATMMQMAGNHSFPDSDFLSDFDSAAEDTDIVGPEACLRRLAELQETVADCIRISQENLAIDCPRRRRAAHRGSKRRLRKYVSKPDLRRLLKDIDEAQSLECDGRVKSDAAATYRYGDCDTYQGYDACLGYDAAGLFYQAHTMHAPSLLGHFAKNKSKKEIVAPTSKQVAVCVPRSQLLFGICAKKLQRALTKVGEACSALSLSPEKASANKRSLFARLRKAGTGSAASEMVTTELTAQKEAGARTFELPPVVQLELGEALDVPVEKPSHSPVKQTTEGPGSRLLRHSDSCAGEQPGNGSGQRLCSEEHIDQCSASKDKNTRTDAQCALRRVTLFVQRYCNMAGLVLLSEAAEEDEAFVYSLWRKCIAELGDLEVTTRSWQDRSNDLSSRTSKDAEVCYSRSLHSIRGSLPSHGDKTRWHLHSIQSAHGRFLSDAGINNINALSFGQTWIQATRSDDHEVFKVTSDDHNSAPTTGTH